MHKILSIRMKAKQFTDHSRVKIWFPSRTVENLAQPTNGSFTEILILTADE